MKNLTGKKIKVVTTEGTIKGKVTQHMGGAIIIINNKTTVDLGGKSVKSFKV